jgi:hypothetical protein
MDRRSARCMARACTARTARRLVSYGLQDALVHRDLGKACGLGQHAAQTPRRRGVRVRRGARLGVGWLKNVSLCHCLNA